MRASLGLQKCTGISRYDIGDMSRDILMSPSNPFRPSPLMSAQVNVQFSLPPTQPNALLNRHDKYANVKTF